MSATPPDIFDRKRRRLRRDRAARSGDAPFLHGAMVGELIDRLDGVTRSFTRALDLGCGDGTAARALRARGIHVVSADAGLAHARAARGVQCDEDRLPFADASFDLVVAAGGLDLVNDLPGALALIRRVLVPDGLFLGAMIGAGSLPRLRSALLSSDMAVNAVAPRLHPQIDVRAAGDLLVRAGFGLPVADSLRLDLRYRDPFRLIADLRAEAATNLLAGQRAPLGKAGVARLIEQFMASADADGRVAERIEIVVMTGWSPSPGQPRPARRGSATASLTEALRPRPR